MGDIFFNIPRNKGPKDLYNGNCIHVPSAAPDTTRHRIRSPFPGVHLLPQVAGPGLHHWSGVPRRTETAARCFVLGMLQCQRKRTGI